MSTINLRGEAHMYSFDILREQYSSWSYPDSEELRLQPSHPLRDGHHFRCFNGVIGSDRKNSC